MDRIVLASQSPRRKQLLEWAEIEFDIVVAATDESYPPGLSFENIAVHIARNKALAVRKRVNASRIVLAADTIVVLEGQVIGKPAGKTEAIEILTRLSGKKHEVITGVIISREEKEICFADTTDVWFHNLSPAQIAWYVDKYKPYDKAGAYAIQEWIGVIGIKAIKGDFYNVMGLPVSRVWRELKNLVLSQG